VKYALAATSRSPDDNGIMERPQPGQNAAPAGIELSQRGQSVSACAGVGELYESTAIGLLSAFFADAVDLKRMSSGYEVMLAPNLLFQFPDFRREKFY
jgi:hypothetical protein